MMVHKKRPLPLGKRSMETIKDLYRKSKGLANNTNVANKAES